MSKAIRLITTFGLSTALAMSATSNREAELAYGSGQINPARAINPGLIYDADQTDYMKFLCGQGYNPVTLLLISGDVSICSDANSIEAWNLNYPSFALSTTSSQINRTFTRTVTNVGSPASVYKYTVMNAPKNLSIQVVPEVLTFTYLDQKLSFTVSIEGRMSQSLVSASLVWDDGKYQVRSPIVMYFAS